MAMEIECRRENKLVRFEEVKCLAIYIGIHVYSQSCYLM